MPIETERIEKASRFLPWVWNEHLARFEFAKQYVKGKVVVDCACGVGIGSQMFGEAGAKKVEAFDISAKTIRHAQVANTLPRVHFRVSSALHLPLPKAYAEVFIALETIEHLPQDRLFLAEVRRVLKSSGVFICSTPNRTITNPGKQINHKPWNKFHVREYSRDEFLDLLHTTFTMVELHGQNPQNPQYVRVMNSLGRILPLHSAVRLNQISKLPNLFLDTLDKHQVIKDDNSNTAFEYLVAVCTDPFSSNLGAKHSI